MCSLEQSLQKSSASADDAKRPWETLHVFIVNSPMIKSVPLEQISSIWYPRPYPTCEKMKYLHLALTKRSPLKVPEERLRGLVLRAYLTGPMFSG